MPSTRAHKPRPCLRCFATKPADEFAWGDGTRGKGTYRRRRGICLVCEAADAQAKVDRERVREENRATWTEDGIALRRCGNCREVKVLADGFYMQPSGKAEGHREHRYWCKSCDVARNVEYKAQVQDSPIFKAARNRAQREWRRKNQERVREQSRERYARIKADRAKYAQYLERHRIEHWIRRERRDGIALGTGRIGTIRTPAPRPKVGSLPAAPLAQALEVLIERAAEFEDGPREYICQKAGIVTKNLLEWTNGNRASVSLGVADRVCVSLDLLWWDIWTGDDYENARVVFEGGSEQVAA